MYPPLLAAGLDVLERVLLRFNPCLVALVVCRRLYERLEERFCERAAPEVARYDEDWAIPRDD